MSSMTEEKFWKIVKQSQKGLSKQFATVRDKQFEAMKSLLKALSPEELLDFTELYQRQYGKAYHEDLVASFCAIYDGTSDDHFGTFIDFLISLGKDVYYKVIVEPDVTLFKHAEFFRSTMGHVGEWGQKFRKTCLSAYEEKTGKDANINCRFEFSGVRFIDGESDLQKRSPKLFKEFADLRWDG